MKCPFCGELEDRVIDSRLTQEASVIRRRRECVGCERRYTTYERIEETFPLVIKKDGRREPFDRTKVLAGLQRACEKRPVSSEALEEVVSAVERRLQESGEREVASAVIGEQVMARLQVLDEVAYVRFASVYREFRDLGEFMAELSDLLAERTVRAAKKA
jgi:transcriptional repressor NrdR